MVTVNLFSSKSGSCSFRMVAFFKTYHCEKKPTPLLLRKTKGSLPWFDPRRLQQHGWVLTGQSVPQLYPQADKSYTFLWDWGAPSLHRVAFGSQDRPTKQYCRAYSYLGKGDEGGCFLIVLALNQGAPDIHQWRGRSVERKVSLLMAQKAQGAI